MADFGNPLAGLVAATARSEQAERERLDRAFCYLTPDERQVLTCALAGNHPERLAIHRTALIRALARADMKAS